LPAWYIVVTLAIAGAIVIAFLLLEYL